LKQLRTNNQIRSPELQIIDENGKQLGVIKIVEALKLAQERGLDLVEVSPHTSPPIAKIMDYGKYIYRKEREEKKRGKAKKIERKTIRIGFKTGAQDLSVKAKQAKAFLNEGNIVKIELILKGREKTLNQLGREKLEHFLTLIENFSIQDEIKKYPFGWSVIIKK
jgi:translation initiation factor IF-3